MAVPGSRQPDDSTSSRWVLRGIAIGGGVLALVVIVVVLALFGRDDDGSTVAVATPEPYATEPVELNDEELAARFGDAVVRVEVEGCGMHGSGTAFAINERLLVTNWHVISIDETPVLRTRWGQVREARVLGATESPDVAILQVDEPLTTWIEWANTDQLKEGQHLLGLGYPVPGTDFAATPGAITSFQTNNGVREAIRTDAAFDRGNSGGPALTREGKVAGVVTEMAANADGFQNVPLVFTWSALASTIASLETGTAEFTVDCATAGFVPPVPESFELPELPQLPPPPSPYAMPPLPSTTTVPCPTGTVYAEVTSLTAGDPYNIGSWEVDIRGRVVNNTTAAIHVMSVDVSIPGIPYGAIGFVDEFEIPAGGMGTWSATAFVFDGPQPVSATASLGTWSWADFDLYRCPTE